LPHAGHQGGDYTQQRQHTDGLAGHTRGHDGLNQHGENAGDGEQQFGQYAIDRHHRFSARVVAGDVSPVTAPSMARIQ
jgi:hypothetical protein